VIFKPVTASSVKTITDALNHTTALSGWKRGIPQSERSEYEPFGKLLNRPLKDGPGFTGHVLGSRPIPMTCAPRTTSMALAHGATRPAFDIKLPFVSSPLRAGAFNTPRPICRERFDPLSTTAH